jgi:glycosyltransferase involved in cell wall biosynthesis
MPPAHAASVEAVHRRLVRRADLVLCDSPWERDRLQALDPLRSHCEFLPLGCDFDAFRPGPASRPPRLLFVGDLKERRKRFDRVLAVFRLLVRRFPELRLTVVGNGSEGAGALVPDDLRAAVDLRGYVSEPELRRAYAESRGLLLLSEFEAFGLPVVEALASGTPVYLARQEATEGLFAGWPGVHVCPAEKPAATAEVIARDLARPDAVADVLAARERLRGTFDWPGLASRKWRALAAAWFLRSRASGTAAVVS